MVANLLLATAAALCLFAAGFFYFSSPSNVFIFDSLADRKADSEFSLRTRSWDTPIDSDTYNASSTLHSNSSTSLSHNSARTNYIGVPKAGRRRLTEVTASKTDDDFVAKAKENHFPLFEPSSTFSVIGPTVFPKPTYMYETEDDAKIEDQIVTYLQPTSGKHRPERDAVLVFAAEYGFDTYMLFLMTLYETGWKGDVVVGISKMDWGNESIRKLLEYWQNENGEDKMTVVVYVVPYHCYDLQGNIKPSHRGGMRVCQCHNMFGRKNKDTGEVAGLLDKRHGRTAQTIRYELYWIWSEHYSPSSWILLIDARDTIFQERPFDRVPRRKPPSLNSNSKDSDNGGGMLIFFGENADATSLGKSKYNRKWLTLAYGERVANAFSTKPTICSGSTMGDPPSKLT